MYLILSANTLSKKTKSYFESDFNGTVEFHVLSEMKKLGMIEILKKLLSFKPAKLSIVFEDLSSLVFLDVFKIIVFPIRCRQKYVFYPDLSSIKLPRLSSIFSCLVFFVECIKAKIKMRSIKKELKYLEKLNRIEKTYFSERKAIYINTNMWFGVKAGGSIGHVSGVVNSLSEDFNYKVSYFSVEKNPCLRDKIDCKQLIPLSLFTMPLEPNYYLFSRKSKFQISEYLKNHQVSFIYQRMSLCDYTSVGLSIKYRLPLVIEYNGSEVWAAENWGKKMQDGKTAKMAEDVCLRHADWVVTISDVLRDELIERGVSPERIITYPNGIDPKIFYPDILSAQERVLFREELGIKKEDFVLTFIGTFGPWHGLDVLSSAIKGLIVSEKEFLDKNKIKFLLVGDGAMMPAVIETLSGIGSSDYVILTGIVQQLMAPKYLDISDAFLSPQVRNPDGSRFFGSPTKLFEYMAMEKPLIASALEQIEDIHSDSLRVHEFSTYDERSNPHISCSQTAILCEPGSIDELVQSIKFVVENPIISRLLASNSRKKVMENYTWKLHTEKIVHAVNAFKCNDFNRKT
jgi:glycosyltransferase involved in cell wall biosynthesis